MSACQEETTHPTNGSNQQGGFSGQMITTDGNIIEIPKNSGLTFQFSPEAVSIMRQERESAAHACEWKAMERDEEERGSDNENGVEMSETEDRGEEADKKLTEQEPENKERSKTKVVGDAE